jgi:hypothetical protein
VNGHDLQKSALGLRAGQQVFGLDHTRRVVREMFGEELHLATVRSLANGVCGALNASLVSTAAIGRAYAELEGRRDKSGIKQVDRLLSNDGVELADVMALWVKHVVGETTSIVVAMAWTDFDGDDHTTLCVSLITTHGRATPLAWMTVKKSKLARRRTHHELQMVRNLRKWLPEQVSVEWLADRAFGYGELYELLGNYGWHYTIRFRDNIKVYEPGDDKLCLAASAYVPANGRAFKLVGARLTHERFNVPAAVFVKRKGMKDAWCLATSRADADPSVIARTYGKLFTIEETFHDTKDVTFGMGLRATHVGDPERRDRLLLIIAIAQTLLTLLGTASEASGLDRTLKTNTVKHRTMSLLNQGLRWYARIRLGTLREDDARLLLPHYERILREHTLIAQILRFAG